MTALAQAVTHRRAATSSLAIDVLLVVAGSLVMAALAQVSIKLPFTPVPVTGQTLGVLLVAGSLGAVLGTAAMILYLAEGALGLPFFADGASGTEYLATSSPSAGYIYGFILAAALIGWLAQKKWDRGVGSAIGAFLLGEIVVFTVGVAWLANALGVSALKAMELGLYPFVVGDIMKVLLAAGAFPLMWKILKRER